MGELLSMPYPGAPPLRAVNNEVGCKCQVVFAC